MENDTIDPKILALAKFLKIGPDEIFVTDWPVGETFEADGSVYRVLTDSERDAAIDDATNAYIDEIVTQFPKPYRQYFDRDKFRHDLQQGGSEDEMAFPDCDVRDVRIDEEIYYIIEEN